MQHLLKILLKPDNIPISAMILASVILFAMWWRVARRNDQVFARAGTKGLVEHMEGARPQGAEPLPGEVVTRVHTWPYLLRVELIAMLVVMLVLTVWSITIDAPLEQMADPTRTPNPSKAPWYFLGLQEMLVYFDPWIAGVMLPLLIILGLAAIPYLDVNPKGNGYHGWKDRKFAIVTFLFGFVILWQLLIVIGVFCRGPGWLWFWPWEEWDAQRVAQDPSRNLTDLLGIRSPTVATIAGGVLVGAYYGVSVVYGLARRRTETLRALGWKRYALVAFLLLTMMGLPIKILLRLALSVKYVWVTPWFNI